jgi:hypothetical protein
MAFSANCFSTLRPWQVPGRYVEGGWSQPIAPHVLKCLRWRGDYLPTLQYCPYHCSPAVHSGLDHNLHHARNERRWGETGRKRQITYIDGRRLKHILCQTSESLFRNVLRYFEVLPLTVKRWLDGAVGLSRRSQGIRFFGASIMACVF